MQDGYGKQHSQASCVFSSGRKLGPFCMSAQVRFSEMFSGISSLCNSNTTSAMPPGVSLPGLGMLHRTKGGNFSGE